MNNPQQRQQQGQGGGGGGPLNLPQWITNDDRFKQQITDDDRESFRKAVVSSCQLNVDRLEQEAKDAATEKALTRREKEQTLAEKQAEAEKKRKEDESASQKSAREAAAKMARGFALFTKRMTVSRFSGSYRLRVTTQFMDMLTPKARNHFNAALATCEKEDEIVEIFMALARIADDEERFQTACDMGLIPNNHRREER